MRPRRSRRYLRPDNDRHRNRVFARESSAVGVLVHVVDPPLVRSPAMLRHVLGNKRTCVEGWVQSVPRRVRERVVQIWHGVLVTDAHALDEVTP